MLDSVTLEEANSDFVNWVKQRSRWYKGYLQTWMVHMRHPVGWSESSASAEPRDFVLFVGGTPLLAAPEPGLLGPDAAVVAGGPAFVAALFPPLLYYVGMTCWSRRTLLVYSGVASARASGKPQLVLSGLVVPLYWGMMALAAVKAFVQLVFQPSYWEKTTHGLPGTGPRTNPHSHPAPARSPSVGVAPDRRRRAGAHDRYRPQAPPTRTSRHGRGARG